MRIDLFRYDRTDIRSDELFWIIVAVIIGSILLWLFTRPQETLDRWKAEGEAHAAAQVKAKEDRRRERLLVYPNCEIETAPVTVRDGFATTAVEIKNTTSSRATFHVYVHIYNAESVKVGSAYGIAPNLDGGESQLLAMSGSVSWVSGFKIGDLKWELRTNFG